MNELVTYDYDKANPSSIEYYAKKLIGMTPYSDGIELHQEGAKVKRLVFQGFDSWFMMNVLSLVGG